jgi:hypothetical protein
MQALPDWQSVLLPGKLGLTRSARTDTLPRRSVLGDLKARQGVTASAGP